MGPSHCKSPTSPWVLGQDKNGCLVVQEALESATWEMQMPIMTELKGKVCLGPSGADKIFFENHRKIFLMIMNISSKETYATEFFGLHDL